MATVKTAVEVLVEGEHRLRDLVGLAAAQGEYEDAVRIAEWARTMGVMAREAQNGAPSEQQAQSPAAAAPIPAGAGGSSRPTAAGRRRRAVRKENYPRFFRRQDLLVKVGWSKSESAEYEHKAPRPVVDAVARRISRAGSRSQTPFTAESLSDVHRQDDDTEIPGYQLYLCLGWLKQLKLIRQHGRQGYSLARGGDFSAAVERAWKDLPEQS
jgi:hypothetical protein